MTLAQELEVTVKSRLSHTPLPDGCDGEEIEVIGKATYVDLCRFIADGWPTEKLSESVTGGVDIDVLPAITAIAALIGATKNLFELYEMLKGRLSRKPTQEEFEEEANGYTDIHLVGIAFRQASERN